MQMAETLNTASDWHQLAIHKLADWTELHVLLFFLTVLYDKKNKKKITQTLLHKVKQQNETGVVGKF